MEFGLAIISNLDEEKNDIIQNFSKEIASFLRKKEYGNGIKSYTIGIVCVEPIYEQFFKVKKPKYTKGKKTIIQEGLPFTLEDNFEYDIKIEYIALKHADILEAKRILAKEILLSLDVLDSIMTKLKGFDAGQFKMDLNVFFKKNGYLK